MPIVLEPKSAAAVFALKAFLIKEGQHPKNLSLLMEQPSSSEICLEPAQARDLSRVCRKLSGELTALADQAQGIKFPNK